jgi:hypothetical protein
VLAILPLDRVKRSNTFRETIMKRKSIGLIALVRMCSNVFVAFVLFAAPVSVALGDAGGHDRPYLGTCDTVIPPPPASFPAVVEIGLSCHLRHLGLTTGTIVQTLNAAGPPSNGVLPLTITDGHIAYIAANGDELHATFEGDASINFATGTIDFAGIETFSGGTGRFSDASGTSNLEGSASAASLTGFYVSAGTLSY